MRTFHGSPRSRTRTDQGGLAFHLPCLPPAFPFFFPQIPLFFFFFFFSPLHCPIFSFSSKDFLPNFMKIEVKHRLSLNLNIFSSILSNGEGSGTPLQYSCRENHMDGGAWWAAVHGVATSRIRLSDFTFTFHFHALEKEMATHSSVLAWRIPGTGESGGLPSRGSHRVGHD